MPRRTKVATLCMGVIALGVVMLQGTAQFSGARAEEAPADAAAVPEAGKFEGDAAAIEAGRQIYGNTCLFCHGPKGVGARAPNLVEGMFKPGRDSEVPFAYEVIRKGRPGTIMGGFEGMLSDDQVWQVIAYLREEGRAKLKK
ncbi:MAG: cytochrome c [Hyphomicrobium sp.]|nr:cytochrome c [Hyphomicrobium sp.]